MKKRVYLLNALSLNMASSPSGFFRWQMITIEEARSLLTKDGFSSAIGHQDLANVVSDLLGLPVEANRANVLLEPGDLAVVAQYRGPRLPEGTTQLPEGAKVEFYLVEVG
jgi:hypothetical protein